MCPELIFVPPRFDVYRDVSRQIRAIFLDYTPLVEPLSLDEAYLDVTDNLKNMPSATRDRRRDPRAHPGEDRAHRLGRRFLQQVPGQARLGLSQAQQTIRHHAGEGPGLRRGLPKSASFTVSGR